MGKHKEINKESVRKERAKRMNVILKKLFPGEIKTNLTYRNPWELLVAVMLSAQCTDKKVNEVTPDLYKAYPRPADYCRAHQEELEQYIRSTGFYHNKAKNIKAAAREIQDIYQGEVPSRMEDLLKLPGVARKTANVVLSNAFGVVEGIAVDTHVRRFALRFDLSDSKDPKQIEKDLMNLLPKSEWFDFSNRLILYGRTTCPARKHACEDHPLTLLYPKANEIWPRAHA